MTKKQFLKKLEEKLKILNEAEKSDIINEYNDIINEKIKDGQSEKAAIEDFGDLDDLAKEILKAYKVDPEYDNEKNNDSFDKTIEKAANWLSEKANDFFDSLKNDQYEITAEKVFEVVLKLFIVLILLYILRLPILLITGLGMGIFSTSIFPFSLIQYLWLFIVEVGYIFLAILIILAIFKNELFTKKEETKAEKPKKETKPKQAIKPKEAKTSKISAPTTDTNSIFKAVIIIVFVIPIILAIIGVIPAMALAIYFFVQGVKIHGIIILLIGIIMFFAFLLNLAFSLINKEKIQSWLIIVAAFFIMLGAVFTVDWALGLSFEQEEADVLVYEKFIISKKEYQDSRIFYQDEIMVDNQIEAGELVVKIYFNEKHQNFVNVDRQGIRSFNIDNFQNFRRFSKTFIEGLKEDKVYIPYYHFEVYASQKTIDDLEK